MIDLGPVLDWTNGKSFLWDVDFYPRVSGRVLAALTVAEGRNPRGRRGTSPLWYILAGITKELESQVTPICPPRTQRSDWLLGHSHR